MGCYRKLDQIRSNLIKSPSPLIPLLIHFPRVDESQDSNPPTNSLSSPSVDLRLTNHL